MRLVKPPWGWREREEPGRTLFVGFDLGITWPLAVLFAGGLLLGHRSFGVSVVSWLVATAGAALLALLRGFRLEVGPRGFTLWRTWCWIPYRRVRLPLEARVVAVGGFGEPPDRMVIEGRLFAEDVVLGSSSTCEALSEAVRAAQERWRAAAVRAAARSP